MQYNILIALLICITIVLLLLKNNFLFFFVALELLFLTINLQWIFYSLLLDDTVGISVALILIAMAAIDAAIGLSLLLRYFSVSFAGKIELSAMTFIKG